MVFLLSGEIKHVFFSMIIVGILCDLYFMFAVTTTPDGQMKIVKSISNQAVVSGKTTLTSLLTSNSNKLVGRRLLMTKAADGTTRVVANAANILPKNVQSTQQSLIKVQTSTGVQPTLQTVQIQQPGESCFCCVWHFKVT